MQSVLLHIVVVEISIIEVKSDALTWAPIIHGIGIDISDKIQAYSHQARDELLML